MYWDEQVTGIGRSVNMPRPRSRITFFSSSNAAATHLGSGGAGSVRRAEAQRPTGPCGAESVAIVGSILLAFAIDAWCDTRAERAEEQAQLVEVSETFTLGEILSS